MRHRICIVVFLLCSLSAHAQWHSIDTTDPRGVISLSELLRVIQLYNADELHCEADTEDGYAPGTGEQSCTPNDLDYNPQDWSISLSELLRAIQFYDLRGYSTFCSSEDGFKPGIGEILECGEGEWQFVEMISVAAGGFEMGRSTEGDDARLGGSDELPVHTVTLSAYEIGKYEVTNHQYCAVLNHAIASSRIYLCTSTGAVWSGRGDIYAGGNLRKILGFGPNNNIGFSEGSFSPKTRVGLPGRKKYSTGTHPVQYVTWYGAASFANWLSEMEGLTPVYDWNTAGWPANFANNGYHLPTEAQWERAAAWDGTKHWIYGFTEDALTGKIRANYYDWTPAYLNPLGLTDTPYTSPVGWFNGVNVSPNGAVSTTKSVSPVGCYDMSGNILEWCHDWYAAYGAGAEIDPPGAASGSDRVVRGGSWSDESYFCRSAQRGDFKPGNVNYYTGFRLAR